MPCTRLLPRRGFGWGLASLMALACGAPAASPPNTPRPPDFELEALDGSSVRLSHHVGRQVILLEFWATYCEPCLRALPELDALYRRHRADGLLVLGIAIDGPDSVAGVRSQVRKLDLSFPILLDQETRVVALYNPKTSAPFSVLIGKDGRILERTDGFNPAQREPLERRIALELRR